jgi:hypothetical protein
MDGYAVVGKPTGQAEVAALMIHDQERSTTHRRGRTTKPFASGGRRTDAGLGGEGEGRALGCAAFVAAGGGVHVLPGAVFFDLGEEDQAGRTAEPSGGDQNASTGETADLREPTLVPAARPPVVGARRGRNSKTPSSGSQGSSPSSRP